MNRVLVFWIVLLTAVGIVTLTAQDKTLLNKSVQVLLKGKVTDKNDHLPVETEFFFRDKNDNKIDMKSNKDGEFELVLNAGENYTAVFNRYDILKEEIPVEVLETKQFIEQNVTLEITVLKPGLVLYQAEAFKQNSAQSLPELKKVFDELSTLMRFNRSAKFIIRVNASDIAAEKNTPEHIEKLLDERLAVIGDMVKKNRRMRGRISMEKDNCLELNDGNKIKNSKNIKDGDKTKDGNKISKMKDGKNVAQIKEGNNTNKIKEGNNTNKIKNTSNFLVIVQEAENIFD